MARAAERGAAPSGTGRSALLGFAIVTKFAVLAGAVYAVFRWLPVHPLGFLLGVSIFVVAVLAAAVRGARGAAEAAPSGVEP
jgi:hypothetical protein